MEAQEPRAARALRVAVIATDPVRRAGLVAIMTGAGHEVIDTVDQADVVLAEARPASSREDARPAQIDAALRAAVAGLIVRGAVLPRPVFGAYPSEDAPLLTPREIEVLAVIGEQGGGATARIFPHTVKFYIEALFDKLDVTSRAEAVHKGLKRGLIDL
jgi:two-component system, NarL family, nitrate/nitrite response regulator NarL